MLCEYHVVLSIALLVANAFLKRYERKEKLKHHNDYFYLHKYLHIEHILNFNVLCWAFLKWILKHKYYWIKKFLQSIYALYTVKDSMLHNNIHFRVIIEKYFLCSIKSHLLAIIFPRNLIFFRRNNGSYVPRLSVKYQLM